MEIWGDGDLRCGQSGFSGYMIQRLEHPNWAILAVLVLANAHYVGTIATKALMRCVGIVAGALLGVWVDGAS